MINDFISGKKNFIFYKWYPEFVEIRREFDEFNALIVDENDNFKLRVKFTHEEVKKYKEIKDVYYDEVLNDNDKVIVRYFEILEIF